MERPGTPVGQQWRLRAALRQARAVSGLSLRTVADALEWSDAKLSRIETGVSRVSITDLKALLAYYDVTDPAAVAELLELARDSKRSAWWDAYRPYYRPDFIRFLGLEASAVLLRQYQLLLVPGLLQTPEYTRALVTSPLADDEQVERDMAIRARRQEPMLAGAVEYDFVVDEGALLRRVPAPAHWRRQLEHLLELAELPNVTIRVLPFAAGMVRGMATSFKLFDLAPDEPASVVLLEHPEQDTLIVRDETRAAGYVEYFRQLSAAALSAADTRDAIATMLR
jgi:transcriptional regulator with XRE-family HTH domain